jgi:hypothetical protein
MNDNKHLHLHRETPKDEIERAYLAHGGKKIVHEYNEDGRPATLRDYLGDIALMLAALAAAVFVWVVVF